MTKTHRFTIKSTKPETFWCCVCTVWIITMSARNFVYLLSAYSIATSINSTTPRKQAKTCQWREPRCQDDSAKWQPQTIVDIFDIWFCRLQTHPWVDTLILHLQIFSCWISQDYFLLTHKPHELNKMTILSAAQQQLLYFIVSVKESAHFGSSHQLRYSLQKRC